MPACHNPLKGNQPRSQASATSCAKSAARLKEPVEDFKIVKDFIMAAEVPVVMLDQIVGMGIHADNLFNAVAVHDADVGLCQCLVSIFVAHLFGRITVTAFLNAENSEVRPAVNIPEYLPRYVDAFRSRHAHSFATPPHGSLIVLLVVHTMKTFSCFLDLCRENGIFSAGGREDEKDA